MAAVTFSEMIQKFNHNHDSKGRFASGGGATGSAGSSSGGLAAAVLNAEKEHIHDKVETANVFDQDGNLILKKTGGTHSVGFDYSEYSKFSGATMTHNHPNERCFSPEDVSMAVRAGLGEIRATNPNGDIHSLQRVGVPHRDFPGDYSQAVRSHVDEARGRVRERLPEYRQRGTHESEIQNEFEKDITRQDVGWLQSNATRYGYNYTYTTSGITKGVLNVSNDSIVLDKESGEYRDNVFKSLMDEYYAIQEADEQAGLSELGKSQEFSVYKTDDDKQMVFGWANVSARANGEVVQDWQNDIIAPEDLEAAAYEYVLNFRDAGEEHIPTMRKKGKLIESCVFTKEKMQAMGIPSGILPEGWWVGFKVTDPDTWQKVKSGEYQMFSIEGKGQRVPVEKSVESVENAPVQAAKSFSDVLIEKFNPNHDSKGLFSTGSGAASFTWKPGAGAAYDNAIAREKERNGQESTSKPATSPQKPDDSKPKAEPKKEPEKPSEGKAEGSSETRGHRGEDGLKLSETEREKIIQEELGCDAKTAKTYFNAVYDYSSSDYSTIRSAQRGEKASAAVQKKADAIEEYIDKAPKWNGGEIYRGMAVTPDVIAGMKPGAKIDMGGTSSWTSDKKTAQSYTRGTIGTDKQKVVLVSPKTSSGTSITHLSHFGKTEGEVLVSQRAQFTVSQVRKRLGVTYIYVDEN